MDGELCVMCGMIFVGVVVLLYSYFDFEIFFVFLGVVEGFVSEGWVMIVFGVVLYVLVGVCYVFCNCLLELVVLIVVSIVCFGCFFCEVFLFEGVLDDEVFCYFLVVVECYGYWIGIL